ncbi:MAG: sigma-54-dependent Fis family transcriptional regulator [Rhodoferax sp.]
MPQRMPEGEEQVPSEALQRTLLLQHTLIEHAKPVMAVMFEQLQDTRSMVILANAQGTLMHTLGAPSFLQRTQQVALSCGANWSESVRGTNAIGTALTELGPVSVFGAEHFLQRNAFLMCIAAPILSGTGKLLGALDISGDFDAGHAHTHALVSMGVRLLENRLLQTQYTQYFRLAVHTSAQGLGTVAEGILVLSEAGEVLGANRAALSLFDLAWHQLAGLTLEKLIDQPLAAVLKRCAHSRDAVIQILTPTDRTLFLSLHCPQSRSVSARVQTLAESTSPAVVQVRGASATPDLLTAGAFPLDALANLDTGDAQWASATAKVRRIAGKSVPLLIQGESGVGKELFARAVHDSGPQRGGPFVAINCAAMPEHLIEAELFGYVGGAFTGGRREGSPGLVRQAHGGTLFLDEIGDMPLSLQTRLLRVLQERCVTPVGGSAALPVDFVLTCATHRHLPEAVAQGKFRQDLYYRINGLTVVLPPLRARSDMAVLIQRLLVQYGTSPPPVLAPDLLQSMLRYDWPGNVRQLANVLRTACAMLEPGEATLHWVHLSDDILEALRAGAGGSPPACRDVCATLGEVDQHSGAAEAAQACSGDWQSLSRRLAQQALARCGGNVSLAARQLGVSRQTLYRKLGR